MAGKYCLKNVNIESDKMKEECGVFGIYSRDSNFNAASITYLGLHALQHRGQESGGICVNNRGKFNIHKDMGLITNIFDEELLKKFKGGMAIGHVRYSTTGSSRFANAQPLLTNSIKGELALAHNGNIVNNTELRENLEKQGSIFHSTLDTEVLAHLVARSFKDDIIEAFTHSLQQLKGAFSMVAMTADSLIAARDPNGFRPLALGKLGDNYVIASETCAFDIIDAQFIREINPGEILIINDEGLTSFYFSEDRPQKFCIFEFIYLARPDSMFGGLNVHQARREMGKEMAREIKPDVDLIIPVPSSGVSAALGFAEESGIPYENGILRNKYVGRTFIQPTQKIRDFKVRIKLNPIKKIIKDKRVMLVDDSIVRGTTSKQIIRMVREAGAKEVHMAISSPPVKYPCYYGLDTSSRQELIASEKSTEEICEFIGADSLHYLSKEGLLNSIEIKDFGFCTSCFDGKSPLQDYIHTPKEEI